MRRTVRLRTLRGVQEAEPGNKCRGKVVALACLSPIVHRENADVIRFWRAFCKGLHSSTDGLGKAIDCLAIKLLQKLPKSPGLLEKLATPVPGLGDAIGVNHKEVTWFDLGFPTCVLRIGKHTDWKI